MNSTPDKDETGSVQVQQPIEYASLDPSKWKILTWNGEVGMFTPVENSAGGYKLQLPTVVSATATTYSFNPLIEWIPEHAEKRRKVAGKKPAKPSTQTTTAPCDDFSNLVTIEHQGCPEESATGKSSSVPKRRTDGE